MKSLKWHYFAIAFVSALLVFGGGFYLWERFKEAPLLEDMENIEGVKEADFQEYSDKVRINLEMDYVTNIYPVIREIDYLVKDRLDKDHQYSLSENRNGEISHFVEEVKPALHEGARKGNYLEIKDYVEGKSKGYDFDECRFLVDSRRMYLQVKQDDYYAYVIVPLNYDREGEEAR